jgi:hypothetical protein
LAGVIVNDSDTEGAVETLGVDCFSCLQWSR